MVRHRVCDYLKVVVANGPVVVACAGGAGSFEVRRAEFRQGGLPNRLLVITDLSRAWAERGAHMECGSLLPLCFWQLAAVGALTALLGKAGIPDV